MVWPLVAVGIGVGALITRRGLIALRRFDVRWADAALKQTLPKVQKTVLEYTRNLQGFESPMSVTEACKILNVPITASKDIILGAHRNLMLRNHPDNGGSNFIASKVNEAKELLLGNRT